MDEQCGAPNALHGDGDEPAPGAASCVLAAGHADAHVAWTDSAHVIVWQLPGRIWG